MLLAFMVSGPHSHMVGLLIGDHQWSGWHGSWVRTAVGYNVRVHCTGIITNWRRYYSLICDGPGRYMLVESQHEHMVVTAFMTTWMCKQRQLEPPEAWLVV